MSVTNTEQKNVKSLLTRKGRRVHGRFQAEGIRLLEQAYRHRVLPETIYYSSHLLSDRGYALLKRFSQKRVLAHPVSTKQIQSMSDTVTSQGIVGVFEIPRWDLTELYRRSFRKLLLCENISDPGNLGTLIRSAAAFGFNKVVLCGKFADPFSPKVVRSSAGAVFAVTFLETSVSEMLNIAEKKRFVLIAADIHGREKKLSKKMKSKKNVILAIGSEAEGLSKELTLNADLLIRIDHTRKVDSLNAAVAGSIIMSQLYG